MATKLVLPGITSFTGPKIYADPIMSKGSLLLWDPTHPMGGDAGGVAHNTPLSNIAAGISAGILEVDPSAAHPVVLNVAGGGQPTPSSLKERSGKGGLSVIFSKLQTIEDIAGVSHLGVGATFLRQYMFDRRHTHDFFASVWVRSLRSARQGSNGNAPMPLFHFSTQSAATGNYLLLANGGTVGGPTTLGERNVGATIYNTLWDTDAPRLVNQARRGTVGWATGTVEGAVVPKSVLGSGDAWGGFNEPGLSGVIERFYIEDLTVSGRSYAEVDAIDKVLFDAAHAPGGSWYGDTYTDPATFP